MFLKNKGFHSLATLYFCVLPAYFKSILILMVKFSLCIPSYKQDPRLLERCIKSILSQSFKNYEILICQQADDDLTFIKDKYPEIRLVKQSQPSVSLARVSLYRASTGDYVWFIDSDDYLYSSSVIAELTNFISGQKYLSDMYLVNIVRKNGDKYTYQDNEQIYKALHDSSSLINLLLSTNHMNSLCCKIVRNSIEIDEDIPSIFQGEDKYLSLVFAKKIKSVTGININAYCYENNCDSGTHLFKPRQILGIACVTCYIETNFSSYCIRLKGYALTLKTITYIVFNGFNQKKLTRTLFKQICCDENVNQMMNIFKKYFKALKRNISWAQRVCIESFLGRHFLLLKIFSKLYLARARRTNS